MLRLTIVTGYKGLPVYSSITIPLMDCAIADSGSKNNMNSKSFAKQYKLFVQS